MNEAQSNTIFNNSLKQLGFSHKIADPVGGYGIQNPFDGFSTVLNKNLYWEGKIIKGGIYSFNFNRIEKHQYDNLLQIKSQNDKNICIVNLAIWKSRSFFYFLLLDIKLIEYLITNNKNSLLGKELKVIIDNNIFLSVKKNKVINMQSILDYIIDIPMYQKLLGHK